jgi:hypothetical protein
VVGCPQIAALLCLGYGAVIVGWYQGDVPWWLAVVAGAGVWRTFAAVQRVRQYKAWEAGWDAMDPESAEARAAQKQKRAGRWRLAVMAVTAPLVLIIPFHLPPAADPARALLVVLWSVSAAFCGGGLVWFLGRAIARRRMGRRVEAEAKPVAWVAGQASSSPSRGEAEENLPEYSSRLMGR